MKKISCQLCDGSWIVENDDLEKQQVCPYCSSSIQGKIEFDIIDTLDKAIYGAVQKMGEGVLQNLRQLSGIMMDTAPNLKKEIRIFSKTISNDYIPYIQLLFEQEVDKAEPTILKMRRLFIEEEGLSESWADMICEGFRGALLYYKGTASKRLINVNVNDFEFNQSKEETFYRIEKKDTGIEPVLSGNDSPFFEGIISSSNITSSDLKYTFDGDPSGLCDLALKYYNGNSGYRKDERQAIKLFRESANYHNYVPAYNYLGRIFVRRREFESSLKWYQKSAAASDIEGLCMTGYLYYKGYGSIKPGIPYALGCFSVAASKHHFTQIVEIAMNFIDGKDVPKDEGIAVVIFDSAAREGSVDAQFYLANCYQQGIGIKADYRKAISLYKMASKGGHQEAKNRLLSLQGVLSN